MNKYSPYGEILLDLRTYREYCVGHLPGAIHIDTPPPPLSDRSKNILREKLWRTLAGVLPKTRILVYCRRGLRATVATQLLAELGFTNVRNLGGVENEPLKSQFLLACWKN